MIKEFSSCLWVSMQRMSWQGNGVKIYQDLFIKFINWPVSLLPLIIVDNWFSSFIIHNKSCGKSGVAFQLNYHNM